MGTSFARLVIVGCGGFFLTLALADSFTYLPTPSAIFVKVPAGFFLLKGFSFCSNTAPPKMVEEIAGGFGPPRSAGVHVEAVCP